MNKIVDGAYRFKRMRSLLRGKEMRFETPERRWVVAGLALLLVLVLVLVWAGLTRQFHAASPPTLAASAPLAQVEPPRRESSLAYDPRHHVVLLFGGTLLTADGTLTNETWAWNGQSWQQQHPLTSPPALQGTLVYDGAAQQMLLLLTQVQNGRAVNQMWSWDGANWHQLHPALLPEVLNASLAYDAASGQLLLFGGETPDISGQNGQLTNATWLWNGATWQMQHPSTAPSPRANAALAYDQARQQIVLFGGLTQQGLSSETWLWNGTVWQQFQNATAPSTRQNALLVYDQATRQMLLFGGLNAEGTRPAPDDTWELQQSGWSKIAAHGAPADLYESAVYDAAAQNVLVYAVQGSIPKDPQSSASTPISQTWIWDGTHWKLLP